MKRFDYGFPFPRRMSERPDGEYVLFDEADAEISRLRAELETVTKQRDEARNHAEARTMLRLRDADRLANEVDALIKRGVIDARSPVADALLDYRDNSVVEEKDGA